ncbi:MAG TPA: sialidase family protein, partial [Chitinophagaceae bacterium]|nr:sialidase family protein [Chitinophagaceae bacterium]
MKRKVFLFVGLLAWQSHINAQPVIDTTDRIADTIQIQDINYPSRGLPKPLQVRADVGVATFDWVNAAVLHHARSRAGGLYETRATITPGGDYLLMFPDGGHYGGSKGRKVNDMLAIRSKDKGKTWGAPTIAFDIDYNQHGFIPFIPKNSKRIYAFGTQPSFAMYNWENGLQENSPIGYRYSDDDGYHWSEARFIQPANDPGYRGMSVMRMTETDKGTWLLGSHEGDWSYKPL